MKEKIKILAIRDTIRNAKRTLPVVIIFELYMIISWYITFPHDGQFKNTAYLYGHIALLVFTGISLQVYCILEKNLEKYYKVCDIMQYSYGIFFVLWALYFTYVGAQFRGSFSLLIYFTIIVLVPMCCYIHPIIWAIVEIPAALLIVYLASLHDSHFNSFLTNFVVFTVICTISEFSLYRIRQNSYRRQIELDEDRKLVHKYAYSDILTNLPNRRSYRKDRDSLISSGLPENFTIASFDLNGLKIANDTKGHDAGDELLSAGSAFLQECFSGYGSVYRVGGDEFVGLFNASSEELNNASHKLNELCSTWTKEHDITLSFAYGFAEKAKYEGKSIEELEIISDDLMYDNKKKHHAALMR